MARRPTPRLGALALVASATALAPGCGGSGDDGSASPNPETGGPLARAELWRPAGVGEDPALSGGAPPSRPCDERAFRVEGEAVEVSTGECGYIALAQPLLRDVSAGDTIVVRAWWSALEAPEPAVGTLALYLGHSELWQELVPIPGRPDAREAHVTSPVSAKAGTPFVFHLSNHGANAWSLAEPLLAK